MNLSYEGTDDMDQKSKSAAQSVWDRLQAEQRAKVGGLTQTPPPTSAEIRAERLARVRAKFVEGRGQGAPKLALKVLVATRSTQGRRKNDFCHAPEGQLVMFGSECDGESVDGRCGCRRCLVGVDCLSATTTFKVVEMDMTIARYVECLKAGYLKTGFFGEGAEVDEFSLDAVAREDAKILLETAAKCRVGQVVEKRGNKFVTREPRKDGTYES